MGRNIFAFPERIVDGRYETDMDDRFFDWRQHDMWAFLGGWETGVGVPSIANERGVPADGLRMEPFIDDPDLVESLIGASWLSVRELVDFDYDATFVGTFRITEEMEDDCFVYVADPEAATTMTFRRFLGPGFFDELARLAASGAERIVFFYA